MRILQNQNTQAKLHCKEQ